METQGGKSPAAIMMDARDEGKMRGQITPGVKRHAVRRTAVLIFVKLAAGCDSYVCWRTEWRRGGAQYFRLSTQVMQARWCLGPMKLVTAEGTWHLYGTCSRNAGCRGAIPD